MRNVKLGWILEDLKLQHWLSMKTEVSALVHASIHTNLLCNKMILLKYRLFDLLHMCLAYLNSAWNAYQILISLTSKEKLQTRAAGKWWAKIKKEFSLNKFIEVFKLPRNCSGVSLCQESLLGLQYLQKETWIMANFHLVSQLQEKATELTSGDSISVNIDVILRLNH